ncbi:MAG: hypothetical protein RMK81_15915, partial [Geminicoccaceae bacterium]|nr:hypothetical protein [Geminicoccaceae bacterium]
LARLEARREAALLAPILEEPGILGERGTVATVEEELAELELEDPALDRLRQETLALWSERHRLDAEELAAHLARCGLAEPVARVRSASGTGGAAGGDEEGVSPLERWRAMAPRRRRRLDRERELEALASGARDAFAGRPLGGLDRLLNERDEDGASEPVEPHAGRAPR